MHRLMHSKMKVSLVKPSLLQEKLSRRKIKVFKYAQHSSSQKERKDSSFKIKSDNRSVNTLYPQVMKTLIGIAKSTSQIISTKKKID